MNVLLVNPPDAHNINCSFGKTNTPPLHVFSPPLGLMYIKAYLKDKLNDEIRLFNFQVPSRPTLDDFKQYLRQFRPDVVGITVNTFFWFDVCQVVQAIREIQENALVVGGGAHMWIHPEESLRGGGFDVIVQGAGEIALARIIQTADAKESWGHIKGLYFRDGDRIRQTPPNDHVIDLNKFPLPDRADVDISQYRSPEVNHAKTAVVLSSSGCPFNCFYCCNKNRKYRARDIDQVIAELLECQESGYEAILFSDEVFTCSAKHTVALCQAMVKSGFCLPWSCRTRVDCLSRETVQFMVNAGCKRVNLGVESGSQETLDAINKKITLEQCRQAFSLCRQEGLQTAGYFMIGFPGETTAMAQKTLDFADALDPDYAVCTLLFVFPGTELYRQAVADPAYDSEWLKRYILNPRPNMDVKLWLTDTTEAELVGLINRFYRRYYLKPHRIMRHLLNLNSFDDFMIKARAGWHIVRGK